MTLQPHELLLPALAGAAAVAALCARARLLTLGGSAAAALIGTACLICGGWRGAAALLAFFVSSNLLGLWRRRAKAQLGFEKGGRRDIWQVLANGGAAALAIVLSAVFPIVHSALIAAFLAALAEANGDTWATEIGAASGVAPRLITTLRAVPPGMSGAVSLPGTAAALAGAALIGLFALVRPEAGGVPGFAIVTLCGFGGALLDSLLGATVQAQYLAEDGDTNQITEKRIDGSRPARGISGFNNDLVNFLCTVAAALSAFLLWKHV